MIGLPKRACWVFLLILAYSTAVFPTIVRAEALSSWSSTSSLSGSIANQVAYSVGANLFSFGGSTTILFSSIYKSSVSASGDLSSWTSLTSIPSSNYYHALAAWDNKVYLLAGTTYPPQSSNNFVYVSSHRGRV